ncbi:MAG TPA: hypothetical protein VGG10_18685 [Rhizomicrobium sp.]
MQVEDGPLMDDSQLVPELHKLAQRRPLPRVSLEIDRHATYDTVARAMAACQHEPGICHANLPDVRNIPIELTSPQPSAMRVQILPDNHVCLESGSEMDLGQLVMEVRKLARQKPRPKIDLEIDKRTNPNFIGDVMLTFAHEGFNHLGLKRSKI